MEYDNFGELPSQRLKQEDFQKQLERVAEIVAIAQEKIDYANAHNPNIQKAIQIVERFLRKTHRICYGGQALNAHLPKAYQFYDPEHTVPDYDFFTPEMDNDLVGIVRDLQSAGFREISARLGIHEGTIKIYVDYYPIADITQMEPALYSLLSERAIVHNKISYLDADTLRMLIYLELSRPKGEVARWEKIYQRLLLLDNFVPLGRSNALSMRRRDGVVKGLKNPLNKNEHGVIMKYIIQNNRVFAGADLVSFYDRMLTIRKQNRKSKSGNERFQIGNKYPIIFFVKDLHKEGQLVKDILQDTIVMSTKPNRKVKQVVGNLYSAINGDMLPEMLILYRGSRAAALLIQESACHSYYNFVLNTGENLKIASVDTLATLYFALGIRGMGAKRVGDEAAFLSAFESLARQVVRITRDARENPGKFPFPYIALECEGEQKSFESLIKEKVQRLRRESVRQRLRSLKELVKNPGKIERNRRFNKTVKN